MIRDGARRFHERDAARVLRVLGQTEPLGARLRLLFRPTFEETVCVVLDLECALIELHRLPRELALTLFWSGGRLLDADPTGFVPMNHPSDVSLLDPAAVELLRAAAASLPEHDSPSPGPSRDGMMVRCELVCDGVARVYGDAYPVGDGPPGHATLALATLDVAIAAFPGERSRLEALRAYLPEASPSKSRRR